MKHTRDKHDAADGHVDTFTTETEGLAEASGPSLVRLSDGDRFTFRIGPVRKVLNGADLRMLAYNGSIPGPVLHVDQDSEITVDVTNEGDVAATVHWHGLRLENRYDGVPHDTQAPIEIGETFTYKVQFPDAGFYWYHPHIREDFGLEMGLYGTIIVEPTDASYWPEVDRQMTVTLDDLLVEDGHIAAFNKAGPNFTAMGRFGNVMLINGEASFSGVAAPGEVVRLYVVNTANTRIFNFALPGAQMKLVGSDSGRYERETFVDEVLLAPSERAVVDVLFDSPGEVHLENRTPGHTYDLGMFTVMGESVSGAATSFHALRVDPDLTSEHRSIQAELEREPDKLLAFFSRMPLLYGGGTPISYACPMHPDVTSLEAGTCPKCGMTLTPVFAPASYACPMHPEVTSTEPGTCPECGMKLVAVDAVVATSYTCPMHPEVTSTEPGTCPECGMKLVAVDAVVATSYTCPMHPEVTSTEPGTCPECGMKLVAVDAVVATSYTCPMHPEVTSTEPGTCPECGMKLVAVDAVVATSYTCPMHPEVTSTEPGTCPECGMKLVLADASSTASPGAHEAAGHTEHGHGDGLEWEDLMPEINRASDSSNMIWQLIDRETGAENGAISWNFTVGDRVKIRLVNEMESDHPMHHPFHIHGAGRFLVLSRDDQPEDNLVWKDTVLVRSGQTVDILLDVSNPGLWMAHCHIAEHNQSGMMFSFDVARRAEQTPA